MSTKPERLGRLHNASVSTVALNPDSLPAETNLPPVPPLPTKKSISDFSQHALTTDGTLHGGEGESAIPEDKKEEAYENIEDDWQHDPHNPRNWSAKKKWLCVGIASFYTFVTPLSSSIMAPALPYIALDLGITSETVVALTLSIFLLSFAIAPLFYAPLSEIYGRKWVLDISNVFFIGFNFGCAFAPSTGALVGLRFLCGWVGAAPLAVGGGIIGDLFSEKDRAPGMALYSLGPLIGPAIGPVMGGYLAETVGWKYCFILVGCLSSAAGILGVPLLRESYAPVIRLRLAKGMSPEEAMRRHPHLQEAHDPSKKWAIMRENLERPFILLTRSLICFALSLYMALVYGIYYLMFATFPELFASVYGFSSGSTGLTYLGLGLGFILATALGGHYGNVVYLHLVEKNGGVSKPEYRLPALIFGSLFAPIGLFWYGWSAQAGIHWIMPIIGCGIFGFGLMAVFLPIQLYLVDTYTYAASALSAASVVRSLLGFAFPLFASQMFDVMGLGGGNSFLAGLAILFGIPFPIWLWFRGEKMRAASSLTR
ncbi:multidrug resistance protein 4 [Peniophora sp. CONT]|nr:multidrug resistance protein 4 [Peniophora sp. CONT]